MNITLNRRLIPEDLQAPVEQLVRDHLHPVEPSISYLEDPADETIVSLQPGPDGKYTTVGLAELQASLEEPVRQLLDENGAINSQNLLKPDSRIWVKSDHTPGSLQGLDVEYHFSGTSVPSAPEDAPRRTWHGTLTSTAANELGEISVRLVTNHPLEDLNGREVYQVDLDQPSISSLRQDPDTGLWTLHLPDLFRPGR